MKTKKTVHRSDYPRIYEKINKGLTYFVVKAKRAGYLGKKEEWFKTLAEAKTRATELEEEVAKHGIKGAALNENDRYWLVRGKEMLKPYNVSWHDCFTREVEYQKDLLKRQTVGTVQELVAQWLKERESKKFKSVRDTTLIELKARGKDLVEKFGSLKIIDVTDKMMREFVSNMPVELQTKRNRLNKFNQFFLWVKTHSKQIKDNPCDGLRFDVSNDDKSDIEILTVEEVRKLR